MTLPETIGNPEVVPSLLGATLRVGAALILLIGAAWVFLRWRGRGPQSRREIRILDRAALTRGAGLALVSVANRRLLLSVSSSGARLITALEEHESPTFDEFLDAAENTTSNAS